MQLNDQRLKGYSLYKTKDAGTENKIQDVSSSGSFAQYTDNIDAVTQANYSYVLKSTNPAGVQSNTVAVSVGTVIAPDFEVKINDATNNPGYTTYKITHKDQDITAYTLTVKKPDNSILNIDIASVDFDKDLIYGYAFPGNHTFTLAVKTQTGALPNFSPIVITRTSPEYQLPVLNAVLVGTNVQIDFVHKDKRISDYKLLRTQPTATFTENIVATSLNIGDNTAKTDDISALGVCSNLVYELQMLSDANKKSIKILTLAKLPTPTGFDVQQGATDVQGSFTTSSSTAEAQYKKISDFAWTALTLTGKQFTKPVKDFELGINNYDFQVRALHAIAACHSNYATKSNVQIKNQEKLPVPTLLLKSKTPNVLEVEWNSIANAVNYTVERTTDVLLSNWVNIGTGTTAGNTLQITGLLQNTNYKVRIKAKGDNNQYLDSDYAYLTAKTQDKLPQANLTLVATSSKITASWNIQNNASKYKLAYREQGSLGAWATIDNIPVATTSKEITTGLLQGKTYEFDLYVIGQGDFADADVQNKTVKVKTALQTGFSVQDYGLNFVNFNVTRDANAGSYQIYYKENTSASVLTPATKLQANACTTNPCVYAVTGLTLGKIYDFVLVAEIKPADALIYENSIEHDLQQHTRFKLNAPQGLTATTLGTDRIKVDWSAPQDFPAWGGLANSAIQGYRLVINPAPSTGSASVDVNSNTKTYTFSGLVQGTEYKISVQTLGDGTDAMHSDIVFVGGGMGSNIVIPPSSFTTAPVAKIDDFALDNITVSWTASNPAPTQYQVCYKTSVASTYNCQVATSPYRIIGLTANTAHNIYVLAKGGIIGGQMYADLPSNALTQSTKVKLATPTNLAWTTNAPVGASTVSGNLTWTAVTNAGSYKITYTKPDGSTATFTTLASNGTITYPIINLAPGTYSFTVQALANVNSNFVDSDPANLTNQVLTITLNSPTTNSIVATSASVSANDGRLALTWNAPAQSTLPASAVVTYEINYSKENIWQTPSIVGVSGTSYTISGLEGAKKYIVKIKAVATVNGLTLSSNEVSFNSGSAVTVKKHQGAPSIAVPVANIEARRITANLSSTANTPLRLEYMTTGGYTDCACVGTGATPQAILTSLNPNTAYTLRAYASSSSLYEQSLNSTTVTITTLPEIPVPTLTLTSSSESASTETPAYKGSISATASATVTGATTVSYEYQYRETGTSNWLPATPSASGLFTLLTGAKQYDVQARTKAVINGTTYYSATWATANGIVKKKLPKPTITLATPNNSSIKVTVTSTKGDETNYEVWYREISVGSFGKWSGLITATANPREATITGLTSGKTYEVYVVATHTNAPFYDSSDATSATSDIKVLSQLSPPTNLALDGAVTCQYIRLKWTASTSPVSNVIGYKVRYTVAPVTVSSVWKETELLSGTNGIILDVNVGATYGIEIKAVGDGINWQDSNWTAASPALTATVPACPAGLATNVSVDMIMMKNAPKSGIAYTTANAPKVYALLSYGTPGNAMLLFADAGGNLIYTYADAGTALKNYDARYYSDVVGSANDQGTLDGSIRQVWVELTLLSGATAIADKAPYQQRGFVLKHGSENKTSSMPKSEYLVFTGANKDLFGTIKNVPLDVIQIFSPEGRVVFADRNAGQTNPDNMPIKPNNKLVEYNKQVFPFQWGRDQDGHHDLYDVSEASIRGTEPYTFAPLQAPNINSYMSNTNMVTQIIAGVITGDPYSYKSANQAKRNQFVVVYDDKFFTKRNQTQKQAQAVGVLDAVDPNIGIDWFVPRTSFSPEIKQTGKNKKQEIASNPNKYWQASGSTNPCLPDKNSQLTWRVPTRKHWQVIPLLPKDETFESRKTSELHKTYKPSSHYTPILWYFMHQMGLTTGGFRRYFTPVRYFYPYEMVDQNVIPAVGSNPFGLQNDLPSYSPFAQTADNYNDYAANKLIPDNALPDLRMAAPFIPYNRQGMRQFERNTILPAATSTSNTNTSPSPGNIYNYDAVVSSGATIAQKAVDYGTNRKLLAMVQPTNGNMQMTYGQKYVLYPRGGGDKVNDLPLSPFEPNWQIIPDQVTTRHAWGYYRNLADNAQFDPRDHVTQQSPGLFGFNNVMPDCCSGAVLTHDRVKINQGDAVLRNWGYYWTADVGKDTEQGEWLHMHNKTALGTLSWTGNNDPKDPAYDAALSMPTAYAYVFYLDIVNPDASAKIVVPGATSTNLIYNGTQASLAPTKGSRAYLVRKHRLSGLQVRCVLDL